LWSDTRGRKYFLSRSLIDRLHNILHFGIILICLTGISGKGNSFKSPYSPYGQDPSNHVAPLATFDWSEEIILAYHDIIDLKLLKAETRLEQLHITQPDNLAVDFIEDYIDFFRLYIGEEKELLDKLKSSETRRLDRITILGDKTSPYTRYALAEINLHWGLVYLKFGSYVPSFQRIRRAYKLLEENQKLYPEFVPNLKSLGIIHAMLSTIPDELKWIVKALGGISGTISQGRQELHRVFEYAQNHPFLFTEETTVMYGLVMAYFDNDIDSAWSLMRSSKINPGQSPLASFVFANLAIQRGFNDEAIVILSQKPEGKEYFQIYFLDYMLGLAKLHRLDPDAPLYLKKYIHHFKGRHYIKECYQKLAWHELMQGNSAGYRSNMENIQRFGEAVVDEDQQALKESRLAALPDPVLLKVRLLFDGGYLERAQALLKENYSRLMSDDHLKLETAYRSARIYHGLKGYAPAIHDYLQVLDLGKTSAAYYTCASALNIGLIYETLQYPLLARKYYDQCLALSPDTYRNSLHQKAKAGLNRLEKK